MKSKTLLERYLLGSQKYIWEKDSGHKFTIKNISKNTNGETTVELYNTSTSSAFHTNLDYFNNKFTDSEPCPAEILFNKALPFCVLYEDDYFQVYSIQIVNDGLFFVIDDEKGGLRKVPIHRVKLFEKLLASSFNGRPPRYEFALLPFPDFLNMLVRIIKKHHGLDFKGVLK